MQPVPDPASKKSKKTKAKQPRPPRPLIGWREWVALPDLGIAAIKAKIDTGAATSALHASRVKIDESTDPPTVAFDTHPIQRNDKHTVRCHAPLVDRRPIKSSTGHRTVRPVIAATLDLAGRQHKIELTLINRDAMGFRMLLGRSALRKHYTIDPGKSFLAGTPGKHDPQDTDAPDPKANP